jgi:hypothetical protein
MATTYYNDIQKLYVAYFNRPADTAGLAYYEGVLEKAATPAAVAATIAAITADFAKSDEYKTAYANKTNAEIVNTVYLNIFGRAAEDAGKKYWADLLDAKKVTIDAVVTAVAAGAQGSDAVAFNNKVAASIAFTAALGTTNTYSGASANAVAKLYLSGITDNASFAAATDTYSLGATVAKVNAAGTVFSLQSGLAALDVANTTKTAFLDAVDGKVDGKFAGVAGDVAKAAAETKIGTDVGAKVTALDNLVAGDYTNSSVGVRAALLADQQAANATKLANDQKSLGDANTAIAKVPGLTDALAQLTSANTAVDSATASVKTASIDLAAKLAAYNAQNTTQVAVAADGTVSYTTTDSTGAVVTVKLITLSSGKLVLNTGVTETTNPGITALLASSTAKETADASLTSAMTAQTTAQATVSGLDLTDQAKIDLKAIATAMTIVKLDAGATPTQAQITTEVSSLQAIKTSAEAIAAQTGATQAQKDAAVAAAKAYNDFNALVTTFKTDDNADPLVKAQADLTATVKTDSDAVAALSTALSDLAKANATKAQLDAVNGQLKAAGDAFTANNLLQPVTLDAAHAAPLATAGADIFVAGTTNAAITNFGLLGADALYLGSKYVLNTTGDITKGNDAVLEAFIIKNGANTDIVLEQKAFASSETTPGADLVTITLTGVDSTKVHLNNGIITVS